jgi:branched-chain amino acid transport system permease protein
VSAQRPEAQAEAARRREIAAGLAQLATAEVIDEHRRRPAGRHSPGLALLLAYFRQAPTPGKLALLDGHGESRARGERRFELLELSGEQGRAHRLLDGAVPHEEAAAHEVFLRRLESIGVDPSLLRRHPPAEPDAPNQGVEGGG